MSEIDEDFDDDEATLVEEGVFKVDRHRALEKLMRYQLPDPAMFVLLFVRCAVASGAKNIRFYPRQSGPGLVVRFGGTPFTADSLRHPYASLFTRASKKIRRDRQLAIALLSILRLDPKWITVRSGVGKSRVLLRVSSITEESLDTAEDGGSETIITVLGVGLKDSHAGLLRSRCRLSPIPITLNGKILPRTVLNKRDKDRFVFEEDGVRGWLEIPPKAHTHSFLRSSRYGVYVSNVRHRLPVGQVSGSFNADGLTVSASQFGLVRNSRYKKTLAVVGRQMEAFAMQQIIRQDRSIADLRSALHGPNHRRRWGSLLAATQSKEEDRGILSWFGDVVSALPISPEDEKLLSESALRFTWLREAARRICLAEPGKGPAALRARLWKVPLFFSAEMQWLSLSELENQRNRIGYVPTTKTAFPGLKTAFQALWFGGPNEDELIERFFPVASSDVTPLLLEEKQLTGKRVSARRGPSAPPRLERLGLASLLTRVPVNTDGLTGEVALPFHRFPDGARVHVFDLGKPDAHFDVPGRLRFAAALEGETQGLKNKNQKAKQVIPDLLLDEVMLVYRRAGEEFEIKQQGEPRQDSLRRHLLDYLVWAREQGLAILKKHVWIADVPLFKQQGRASWSYERVLRTYNEGETLFFAPSGNQARGFPGSMLFVGSQFTEEFLAALFPGCALKHFPGREAVLMLYKPTTVDQTVASVKIGGGYFDAAPGNGRGGLRVDSPFGPFRIFGETSTLSGVDASVGARIVSGILREHGSMGLTPEAPLRHWLLFAVGVLYGPWPGKAFESDALRHGMELLVEFPFFQRPEETPWTIAELHARFGKGRPLSDKEITLGVEEEVLIRTLWPKDAPKLLGKRHKPVRAAKQPSKKKATAKKKEISTSPSPDSFPEKKKAPKTLSFSTPMIFERELAAEGVRVLIGLPPELLPGLTVIVKQDGKSRRYAIQPPGLSAAATLYVDADEWGGNIQTSTGKLDARFETVLLGIYNRFLYGLLDMLPKADVESFGYDSILLYLLFHLRGESRRSRKAGPRWSPLKQRIRSSKIVPLLGGGCSSLDELAERIKAVGKLIYVEDRSVDRGDGSDNIPVFRYPRLAAQALGGATLSKYKKPVKTKEQKRVEKEALASFSPEVRLEQRFREIFRELNGRRGLDFNMPKPETFKLVDSSSKRIAPGLSRGNLRINKGNRLVAKIIYSKLSPEAKAEYLATLVYTEVNRKEKTVTDLEDTRFIRSLAYDAAKRES